MKIKKYEKFIGISFAVLVGVVIVVLFGEFFLPTKVMDLIFDNIALIFEVFIGGIFIGFVSLSSLYEKKSLANELNLLKSQLNSHFLYNALNSLQTSILKGETDNAVDYLGRITKLLRSILDFSSKETISLEQEIGVIKLYIDLEVLRFKDKFTYTIKIDDNIDTKQISISPLILQPIVENAISHGLMHREKNGLLSLDFVKKGESVVCTITDNGIGREKAKIKKAEKGNTNESKGTSLVEDRIKLLNQVHGIGKQKYDISFPTPTGDKEFPGTIVKFVIPIRK